MNAGLSGLILSLGQYTAPSDTTIAVPAGSIVIAGQAPTLTGFESGPLAPYVASLWSVAWLKLLMTLYSGPLIRVRRSSDNAEMDVYPVSQTSNAALDSTAMLAWSGSDSVFVKTLYDQSGGGNHWSQTTTSKQPRIVNAGVYDAKLVFDGSNDVMVTVNNGGTGTAKSCFYRITQRNFTAAGTTPYGYNTLNVAVAGHGAFYSGTTNTSDRDVFYVSQASAAFDTHAWNTGTYTGGSPLVGSASVGAIGVVVNRTIGASTPANGVKIYISGGRNTHTSDAGVNGYAGSFTAGPWALGAIENSTSPAPIDCIGFVIMDSADMSADAATICGLL